MPESLLLLVAACALIDTEDRVLITQRPENKPMAGLWEFPGGKIENGERPEQTVMREMEEELGVIISEDSLSPFTFASHAYPEFHLLMPCFLCRRWKGDVIAREGQQTAWVHLKDLGHENNLFPMPPADKPLIPLIRKLL
jgi:8-oxo-dGTP diphosphatase